MSSFIKRIYDVFLIFLFSFLLFNVLFICSFVHKVQFEVHLKCIFGINFTEIWQLRHLSFLRFFSKINIWTIICIKLKETNYINLYVYTYYITSLGRFIATLKKINPYYFCKKAAFRVFVLHSFVHFFHKNFVFFVVWHNLFSKVCYRLNTKTQSILLRKSFRHPDNQTNHTKYLSFIKIKIYFRNKFKIFFLIIVVYSIN